MYSTSINFGPRTLATLKSPPAGRGGAVAQLDYFDQSEPGLYLRASSTGARTWFLMARVMRDGERKLARFKIGAAWSRENQNGMQLADARRAAYELKALIKEGVDPKQRNREEEQQRADVSRNTFAAAVDRFLAQYPKTKKRPLRPATLRQYRDFLKGADFAILNDKPVGAISKRDITRVLDGILERGCTVRANRALASAGKMFRWLAGRGEIDAVPTDYMAPPVQEKPRDRHLFGDVERQKPGEIALAWRAFDRCGPVHGPLLKMLLLTGARLNEAAKMRWNELLDLDGANPRWLIPEDRAKNWRAHVVPLGPLAVEAIRAVPQIKGSDFVFTLNGKKPVNSWTKLTERLNKAVAALKAEDPQRYKGQLEEPWTRHDLRRTVKTGLKELRIGKEVRDALLNHASKGVDEHYEHAKLSAEKRAAIEVWERHVAACLNPAPVSNVTPIRPVKAAQAI